MKKLFAFLALLPLAASAQQFPSKLTPGTFELSGQTSLSFLTSNNEYRTGAGTVSGDVTTWALQGFGLYYLAPGVGVGGTLSYQSLKYGGSFLDASQDTFTLGPVVGVSFPVAPQLDLFARGAIVYASQELGVGGGSTVKSSGFGLGLQGGVKYFVVKNLSLDGALVFQYLDLSADSTPSVGIKSTGFGVNLGLSLYFGNG